MYRYDEFDAQIVKERVDQFRGQVARLLPGLRGGAAGLPAGGKGGGA